MGTKFFAPKLKDFIGEFYKGAKADLYACFIQQNVRLSKPSGLVGMITIPNWMFLSSFEGGDDSKTEGKTFAAVRTAINELVALVGYIINNLNGRHIVVTADHGFLFMETARVQTDKSKLNEKPENAILAKKRYLIGPNLPNHEAAYLAEWLREMRKRNFSDAINKYFKLGRDLKPIQQQMVILGSMSLGGNIVPVENLAESLQVAFDGLSDCCCRWRASKTCRPFLESYSPSSRRASSPIL